MVMYVGFRRARGSRGGGQAFSRGGGQAISRAPGKVRGEISKTMLRTQMRELSGGVGISRGRGRGLGMGMSRPPMTGGRGATMLFQADEDLPNSGVQGPGGVVKMVIANLDLGVSDSDIFALFKEFGEITEAAVHYNSMGKSLSTAHVNFRRYMDAEKAVRQYNGVNLDGRPMKITIEGDRPDGLGEASKSMSVSQRLGMPLSNPGSSMNPFGGNAIRRLQPSVGMTRGGYRGSIRGVTRGGRGSFTRPSGYNPSFRGTSRGTGIRGTYRGGFQPRGVFRGRGVRGSFRGTGRGGRMKRPTPTAAELDAELDAYLREANKD